MCQPPTRNNHIFLSSAYNLATRSRGDAALWHALNSNVRCMRVNQEEVIAEIETAFSDVQRPETSLRQFQITDEKGMSQEISDAEWEAAGRRCTDRTWLDISDSELEECGSQLAHMQGDEFAYYLPAYLRHAVRHYRRPIWEETFVGSAIFHLTGPSRGERAYPGQAEHRLAQFSKLNAKHVSAIIAFLQFIATEGDDIHRPDAMRAFNYWLQYQCT